jgi:hypothetical protein
VRIVSGGQTGVDRAALDFAIAHRLEHGGWCPRGRLAEDGVIPAVYDLRETESADSAARTDRNVLDSDATLIITRDRDLFGGTLLTRECAVRHSRPFLVISETADLGRSVAALRAFLERHHVEVLNVAGPRESEAPGLSRFVQKLFLDVSWTL